MTRAFRMSIAAVLSLVASNSAFADPITIVRADRAVSVRPVFENSPTPSSLQTGGDTLIASVTTPPGTTPATGTATLESTFTDPMHWSGTGSAAVSWTPPADIAASSGFSVEFLVTSPVTYAFDGRMTTSGRGTFGFIVLQFLSTGRFDFDGEELPDSVFGLGLNLNRTSGAFTGVLAPGRYDFFGEASSQGFGSGSSAAAGFSFDFAFAPAASETPEPASMLLLGTGLAGLFGFRGRAATRLR